jgi:hypothetical protein
MKPSFLPLARTTEPTAGSFCSASRISSSCDPISADSVLTGSPGTSMKQVATPSSTSTRKQRETFSAVIMATSPL